MTQLSSELIYPASEKLITKYTKQEKKVVRETAEVYRDIVKPNFLDPMNMDHCNWIYSILSGEKEQENIIFQNEYFILEKDYKFNEGDIRTMYCLMMPIQRDLKTVRDLRADHLPMLKSVRDESLKAIEEKWSLDPSKVRAYFHYLPTYYHLHVHFTHVDVKCDRAIVTLDEAISNIELMGDYYEKCSLTYQIGANMELTKILIEKGIIKEEAQPKVDDVEEVKEVKQEE